MYPYIGCASMRMTRLEMGVSSSSTVMDVGGKIMLLPSPTARTSFTDTCGATLSTFTMVILRSWSSRMQVQLINNYINIS